jgi:hypothetical protein
VGPNSLGESVERDSEKENVMQSRRFEFLAMFAVVLVLNLLFSVWWL